MGLEEELRGFTGTTRYYEHPLGVLYTDGVHYLAEKVGAHWLIDLVSSYQPRLRRVPFQVWDLRVDDDRSAVVTMREDTGQPTLVEHRLLYTDFPLDELSFYCIQNVMMLKTEY